MNKPHINPECERVREGLDLALEADVAGHVATCPECAAEIAARKALHHRLRSAVQSVEVTPEFDYRLRRTLRAAESRDRRRGWWMSGMVAVAATLTIGLGLSIAYQLGHLRMTAASQEAYIRRISSAVSSVMRVGLGDHVHCAVFRKYPKNPPSLDVMTEKLGPQYKDLLPVVKNEIPRGFQVVMAHQCTYHARKFVHVTAADGSHLLSLVVATRQPGEAFESDRLVPALVSSSGLPMYRQNVQRFAVAGFETSRHFVFVISDLDAQRNGEVLSAMASQVRTVLDRSGS